jgi:hypothetical protein
MSTSLYDLTNEFLEVMNRLEELIEDEQTLNDTLDSLKAPLEEKAENIIKYMRSLESLAQAKKDEAKRLQESAASDLKKAERLKSYLDENLKRAGLKNLQAGVFEVKYKKGSEVVDISDDVDFYSLPASIVKIKKEVSKTEAKKLLKEGNEIPGISLVRKPDSLVIK